MKKRLILLLLFMLLGALVFQLMRYDSGYVLIAYASTTVEMSVWTALMLFLLLAFAVYWVGRLVRGGRKVVRFIGSGRRQSMSAQSQTMTALVDFIEGNWLVARKKLIKSADKSINPLVNYLAAARCSYELKDFSGALDLLHKAEKSRESSELAVALTQARMQLGSRRYEQCLATLKRIKRSAPEHPVVLDLLANVYWELDDIDALEELLPSLRRLKVRNNEDLRSLEINVYLRQLQLLEKRHKKLQDIPMSKSALDSIWSRVPAAQQKEPELMAGFAAVLLRLGCDEDAEPMLAKALQKQWREEWVELYGHTKGANPKAQLKTAAAWQKQQGSDAVLLAALGRICTRNQLWGKAKDYFRESLDVAPKADVYLELGLLLEQLGESDNGAALYREALHYLARSQQELPLP
ncbi:heme biosynthesis HemY N-terminal domain-containing protein [Gilvimarinus chinensis]|uniref:heme biosynthesis HemY N-terminal domain-containing protein n=1 Tax=Gilvimarinus chinensis TaxID=396005 RepID=UPI0003724664|nr:heme biosynthesis HemY N-terminal domain-containing protein [Gilvimarinus chinensis]